MDDGSLGGEVRVTKLLFNIWYMDDGGEVDKLIEVFRTE